MDFTAAAHAHWARMFPGCADRLTQTDPEFAAYFAAFAFDEVVRESALDDRTRMTAILAVLLGCQGMEAFRAVAAAALRQGVTAVEIKETVYQAAAYLGIGRVFPFLHIMNEVLETAGVALPLAGQQTVTPKTRLAAGNQTQIDIFGEGMRGFPDSGPADHRHINRWLAANCFGDYYTRTGLDLRQRELITFCFLMAQGGCEPQLTSHVLANLRLGNDKAFLIDVISQCLPYIGYPRSLNALRCVNDAAAQ